MFDIIRPEGDPEMIRSQVKQLGTVADDVDGWASILHTEQGAMLTAWQDVNGQHASAETGALSTKSREYGGHLDNGIAAFTAYARELETAQSGVDGIQRRVESAHLNRDIPYPRTVSPINDYDPAVEADLQGELRVIERDYREIIASWERAAGTCYEALLSASPGFQHGMTPADMRYTVQAALAEDLPAAAAVNQEKIEHAEEVADQVTELLDAGRPIPGHLILEMESGADDPLFAVPFLHRLGPERVYDTVRLMNNGTDGYTDLEQNERLLGALGQMIGTGTNEESASHLSQEWVDGLLGELDPRRTDASSNAWYLSQVMLAIDGDVEFGRDFLERVGPQLYEVERANPDFLTGTSGFRQVLPDQAAAHDPMRWYFTELGQEPLAAQDFLRDDERTRFYLTGRGIAGDYGTFDDGGTAFGSALQAATDRSISGTDTSVAADITNTMVDSLAEMHGDPKWLTGPRAELRTAVGDILVDYARDINESFDSLQIAAGADRGHVLFNQTHLIDTMRLVFTDGRIEDDLVSAVVADQRVRVAEEVMRETDFDDAIDEYQHLQASHGSTLGAMYAAIEGVDAADAAEIDSQNDFLGKGVNYAVGKVVGRVPVVGDELNELTGALLGTFWPTDHEQQSIHDALSGRVEFADEYGGMSLEEGPVQYLRDIAPSGKDPFDQLAQNDHAAAYIESWGAMSWDSQGNLSHVPSMAPDGAEMVDTDGDGIEDRMAGDTDGDGVLDEVEEIRAERATA